MTFPHNVSNLDSYSFSMCADYYQDQPDQEHRADHQDNDMSQVNHHGTGGDDVVLPTDPHGFK